MNWLSSWIWEVEEQQKPHKKKTLQQDLEEAIMARSKRLLNNSVRLTTVQPLEKDIKKVNQEFKTLRVCVHATQHIPTQLEITNGLQSLRKIKITKNKLYYDSQHPVLKQLLKTVPRA